MKSLLIKILLKLFSPIIKSGTLQISYGIHEIYIPCNFQPREVWVNFGDYNIPTCSPDDSDSVCVSINRSGFTILANIKSNKRTINWIAK